MIPLSRMICLLLTAIACGCIAVVSVVAVAETTVPSAAECVRLRVALARLQCFDRLHQTPVYHDDSHREQTSVSQTPSVTVGSALTQAIWQQESTRQDNNTAILSQVSLEHANAAQQRVIISVPALGALTAPAVLSASCSDNITRLQLLLTKPLATNRVVITLRDAQDTVISQMPWRISENGQVLDAGRGIPSIQLLQRLQQSTRLTIDSDQAAIDGIRFDLTQLSQHLAPLQQACHWRGR